MLPAEWCKMGQQDVWHHLAMAALSVIGDIDVLNYYSSVPARAAKLAYEIADAMIAEREKKA